MPHNKVFDFVAASAREAAFAAHNRLCSTLHGEIAEAERERAAHEFLHSFLVQHHIVVGEELGCSRPAEGKEADDPHQHLHDFAAAVAAKQQQPRRADEPRAYVHAAGADLALSESQHIDELDCRCFALATGQPHALPRREDAAFTAAATGGTDDTQEGEGDGHGVLIDDDSEWQALEAHVAAVVAGRKVLVVDVREQSEIDVSRLPVGTCEWARGHDLEALGNDELRARIGEDTLVIAHCAIGARSALFTSQMRKRGIDCWNFHGSMHAWAHAGGVFVDGEGKPTKSYATFDAHFDRYRPSNYTGVY